MVGQVLFVAKDDTEHTLLFFDVFGPRIELLIAALVVDSIAQDCDLCSFEEQVRNMMDGGVTCCVPNV